MITFEIWEVIKFEISGLSWTKQLKIKFLRSQMHKVGQHTADRGLSSFSLYGETIKTLLSEASKGLKGLLGVNALYPLWTVGSIKSCICHFRTAKGHPALHLAF